MRVFIGLCLSFASLTIWAETPRDLYIFNASDRAGILYIEDQDCAASASCAIPVGRFMQIPEHTLRQLCPIEKDCKMTLSVEGQRAIVSSIAYNFKEGVLYATQGRWTKYRAEKISEDALRIFIYESRA